MKKHLLLSLFLLSFIINSNAQVSAGGRPYSFDNPVTDNAEAGKVVLPQLNIIQLRSVHPQGKNGTPYPAGKLLKTNYSMQNSGVWTKLANGGRLWRLMIEVPGAPATNLYFKNFYMPDGAKLYVYNTDKTHVIGAFGSQNNNPSGLFATQHIYNSSFIIEYFEPAGIARPGSFIITEIGNVYNAPRPRKNLNIRGLVSFDFDDSRSCEVDVNCREGYGWEKQRNSVVRILMKQGGYEFWCSGSLVNNTAQDNSGYILTANHCYCTATNDEMNQWLFFFNYQANSCDDDQRPDKSATLVGCTYLASSSDRTSKDVIGSDFQLLELNGAIPAGYNVYYNGWDATGAGSTRGVGISHPKGDTKKIATYNKEITKTGWDDDDDTTHWGVRWAMTYNNNFGCTEDGSSGSPLYNKAGYVIGQLSGGSSDCRKPDSPYLNYDYYGRMMYDWNRNGSRESVQLAPWLDPQNSGTMFLHGKPANSKAPWQWQYTQIAASDPGNYMYVTPDNYAWSLGNITQKSASDVNYGKAVVKNSRIPLLKNIRYFAYGGSHCAAVDYDGAVWTFGRINNDGELGRSGTSPDTIPGRIEGLGIAANVSAGSGRTIILMQDGTLRYYGRIEYYLAGRPEYDPKPPVRLTSPQTVPGIYGVVAISTFSTGVHTLALKQDGTVWAFGGANSRGERAVTPPVNYSDIIINQVPGITNAVAVAAGFGHSLVLKSDGTVWAFGVNIYGQLGMNATVGTTNGVFTPTVIPGIENAIAIAAGFNHSLVLLADGSVMAFGVNTYGELGRSPGTLSTLPNPVPARIPGLKRIVAIAAGQYVSMALDADGKLWRWGSNSWSGGASAVSPAPIGLEGVEVSLLK
ncbi:MAG: trypsin-like serine protease [Chitinophagaceae bacterium]|nr:trypsin-like serine protease [Chitinophagaceae bacterium]